MSLLQLGKFELHSGGEASWRIECDALTDEDLECAAMLIAERLPARFDVVRGVPCGGLRLAEKLEKYARSDQPMRRTILVVDDVLTTVDSMRAAGAAARAEFDVPHILGAVIFARGPVPGWITPLFWMPTTQQRTLP